VGRSIDRVRFFVTCQNSASLNTQVRIYDKAPRGSEIMELPNFSLSIEYGNMPFVSDLNGDFLEDILYSDAFPPNKLKVAF
jgi:hypothetical protein